MIFKSKIISSVLLAWYSCGYIPLVDAINAAIIDKKV